MIRSFGVQSESGRRWVARLVLLLSLVVAFAAWGWVLQRTLLNEREAMHARWKKQRVAQFEQAFEIVERRLKDSFQDAQGKMEERPTVLKSWGLIRDEVVSGVIFPEREFEVGQEDGPWLSDEDGRDSYAESLLSQVTEDEVWVTLRERLEGRVGPEMKASFRAWLIRRALEERGDSDLDKLARSEEARAVGEVPELSLIRKEGELVYWWSAELLENWFKEAGVREVEFGNDGKLFQGWSDDLRVQLEERRSEGGFAKTQRLLQWMAVGSGLLFLLIVVGALWMGWNEMRLAKMRTDLAASVAHELRTPLAGQRVLLESLGTLEQTEEERAEYVEMALRSNRKLSGLVGQFLTFSRLQRGVLQLEGEEVDLGGLVEEVMGDWRDKFAEAHCDVEEGLVMKVDREAVGTILRNLVENAWKYSDAQEKKVVLGMERRGTRLFFAVGDNGKGLSESERRKVFRKFWRADDKLTRKTAGLGLGLSIVKSLAQAHGGDVVVEKASLGGASFEVELEEL